MGTKAENKERDELRYRLKALASKAKDAAVKHNDLDLHRAAEASLEGLP